MEFNFTKPTSVKIDLVNQAITLTFRVPLTIEHSEEAETLARQVDKNIPGGELRFIPGQPNLPGLSVLNRPNEPAKGPADAAEQA